MSNDFKEKVIKLFSTIETFGELHDALAYDPSFAKKEELDDVIWLDVLIQDTAIAVRYKNILNYPHLTKKFDPVPQGDALEVKDWCATQQGIIDADKRSPDLKNINELRAIAMIQKGEVSYLISDKEIARRLDINPDAPNKWKSYRGFKEYLTRKAAAADLIETESRLSHRERAQIIAHKKDYIEKEDLESNAGKIRWNDGWDD